MKRIYCFDFDGTISDTLPLIVKTLNRLLKEDKKMQISESLMAEIKEEGIESVVGKINISHLRAFFLLKRLKLEINKDISHCPVKEGIVEVLEELQKRGHLVGILSSNSKDNLISFLKETNLPGFDFVSTSGLFGKKRAIKKLKRNGNFIYIGDEVRDVKAGKAAGVKVIAVSWGLSSKRSLLGAGADAVIDSPEEILSF